LLIKVGVSYTSVKNARQNLEKEIPDWNFEEVKSEALDLWEKNLSRILIETENNEDKIKFYSALYHMLIHPNIISDISGDYPLMGHNGIGNYINRHRYTIFSLWDTYRTLHPFLTLVYPERQLEMIKTMLDMFKENGYLPKWELAANETFMMVGDPAVPVIVDSYIKGIQYFDVEKALESILKPVLLNEGESAPPIRAGYHQLLKYKYIPFEQDYSEDWWVWGPVSTTLEYCFSDWAISQFSKKLGKNNYYERFLTRSGYYKNLFDKTTLFMRPKLKNGNWLTPFDSLAVEGSGNWAGSGGPGYVEGNAWNYTWFVPHDVKGLIDLFENENIFTEKLIRAFNENHFTINNEPDIAYPYLFTYIKNKEKTTVKLVTSIMKNEFGTGANGLPGNDDCGTISGWFVFSSMGFYPACPAADNYRLGIPLFDKIHIKLNKDFYPGDEIIIEKQFLQFNKIFFNGKEINNYNINHSDMVKGGKLIFK
jgi:predicted alpha-1,2-mannosidase